MVPLDTKSHSKHCFPQHRVAAGRAVHVWRARADRVTASIVPRSVTPSPARQARYAASASAEAQRFGPGWVLRLAAHPRHGRRGGQPLVPDRDQHTADNVFEVRESRRRWCSGAIESPPTCSNVGRVGLEPTT